MNIKRDIKKVLKKRSFKKITKFRYLLYGDNEFLEEEDIEEYEATIREVYSVPLQYVGYFIGLEE